MAKNKSRYVIIKKKNGTQALLASESIGNQKERTQAQPRRSLPAKHNQWVSEDLFMTTPSPSKTVFFNSPAPEYTDTWKCHSKKVDFFFSVWMSESSLMEGLGIQSV